MMSRSLLQTARGLATGHLNRPRFIVPIASRYASNMSNSHLATLDTSLKSRLPASASTLFEAKAQKKLSFEDIARHVGRDEVAIAALFYGQARATDEDVTKLSEILHVPEATLAQQLAGFPDRGRTIDMPPKEPLIYRLFEIVQNYGYAYKAVLNEKFGDGIMSAISFSTKVEKEIDKDGNAWAKITLRGKWSLLKLLDLGDTAKVPGPPLGYWMMSPAKPSGEPDATYIPPHLRYSLAAQQESEFELPTLPTHGVSKEPKFPFAKSAKRVRFLQDEPGQEKAKGVFAELGITRATAQLAVPRVRSESTFYGNTSIAGASGAAKPVQLTQQALEAHAHHARQADKATIMSSAVGSIHRRRGSDDGSEISMVTPDITNMRADPHNYLDKLRARIAKQNPQLKGPELALAVTREARQAYERANAKHKAKTNKAVKTSNQGNLTRPNLAATSKQRESTLSSNVSSHGPSSTASTAAGSSTPAPVSYANAARLAAIVTHDKNVIVKPATRGIDHTSGHNDTAKETTARVAPLESSRDLQGNAANAKLPEADPRRPIGTTPNDREGALETDGIAWTRTDAARSNKPVVIDTQDDADESSASDDNAASVTPHTNFAKSPVKLTKKNLARANDGYLSPHLRAPRNVLSQQATRTSDEDSSSENDITSTSPSRITQSQTLARTGPTDALDRQSAAATVPASRHIGPNPEWRTMSESSESDDGVYPAVASRTGDAADWDKPFACPYKGCNHREKKRSNLRFHKSQQHDYCEKCDLDFDSFDALLLHKQRSVEHTACWICGRDFSNNITRNKHMAAEHPLPKDLDCPGCGEHFIATAAFLRHVEDNECEGITEKQFRKARTMITRIKEISLVEYSAKKEAERRQRDAEEQKQLLRVNNESDFPGLPGLDLRKNNSPMPPTIDTNMPLKQVSGAGQMSGLIKKLQAMSTNGPMANMDVDPAQKRLIELYRRMVGAPDSHTYETPKREDGSILYQAIPDHKLYDPAIFKNVMGRYSCPQSYCNKHFRSEHALDSHLRSRVHMTGDLRCPDCCDKFKTATALVAHMDAPSVRCQIKYSKIYREALEVATGAFLTTKVDEEGRTIVDVNEPSWD